MQAYSDSRRENGPHALPDVEVFYHPDDYDLSSDAEDGAESFEPHRISEDEARKWGR